MTDYVQKKIAPGVELLAVPAGRFKTNELAIHLAVPMEEQMAANYALAISAVSRKGKAYPDMRALHLQLDKLYGAAISVTANKSGGCQVLKMGIHHTGRSLCPGRREDRRGGTGTADESAV